MAGEEPIISGVAGRYATALFELALEQNAFDAVKSDLESFEVLLAESPDLRRFVRSPVFTAEEQVKALSAVLQRAGIGGLTANFLKLVASKRRLFALGEMIRAFRMLVARHRGELTAEVTMAEPPSEQQLASIKDAIRDLTGKDVHVAMKVEPAIIGGLIVKLGSRMIDSSLRTKLNAIKHAMKEVS